MTGDEIVQLLVGFFFAGMALAVVGQLAKGGN